MSGEESETIQMLERLLESLKREHDRAGRILAAAETPSCAIAVEELAKEIKMAKEVIPDRPAPSSAHPLPSNAWRVCDQPPFGPEGWSRKVLCRMSQGGLRDLSCFLPPPGRPAKPVWERQPNTAAGDYPVWWTEIPA